MSKRQTVNFRMWCLTCIKGVIVTCLISCLLCIYAILRSAEHSSRYAKSYADLIGYKGPEFVAKLQIMPNGGDEIPNKPMWDLPAMQVHNDTWEFTNATTTNTRGRFITSNFSFSPGQGNIMFQYASLYALALRYNATLLVPEGILIRRSFTITATAITRSVSGDLLELWKPRLVYPDCCRYYTETEHLDFSKPNALMGYFQSFRYFHPRFSQEIRREFQFLPAIRERARKHLEKALIESSRDPNNVTFVAVHVRRGLDMTWNVRNLEHGHKIATKRYLNNAMNYFRKKYSNALFIVCSDDVYWVRQNLLTHSDTVTVASSAREVDLCVLSMCNHTVMTQGTFSWWAAYLAGGEAVYYKEWPRSGSKLDSMFNKFDYFLPEWFGMD